VKAVRFYADNELIAVATNPPFASAVNFSQQPGTHQLWASVVDAAGRSNGSATVSVTVRTHGFFQTLAAAWGSDTTFVNATGGPYCFYWSDDLRSWHSQLAGQHVSGGSVFVDETTTNTVRRFYKILECL
jgi:hypothetical protein